MARLIGRLQHRFPAALRLGVRWLTRGSEDQRERRGLYLHISVIEQGDHLLWECGIAEASEPGQSCETHLGVWAIQIRA